MKNILYSLLIVIIYISWSCAQEEFIELKQLERRAKKPSFFGHGGIGPFGSGFGFHALAILYWLKVKAVIIAFIVGTAVVWGAKYIWGNRNCPKEIIHEGPIMPFSHGPLWSGHDHIPYNSPSYSFDPHHDFHSTGGFPSSFLDSSSSTSYLDSSPSSISGTEHFASDKKWKRQSKRESRQFDSEDQISNIFFAFLGVDSDACRKRFVCEWEYKSKRTPVTSLVFRVLGKGIFTKYLRNSNEVRSFEECGTFNNECRFIEEHNPVKEYEDSMEENVIVHSHDTNNDIQNLTPSANENETESNNISSTEVNNEDDNENLNKEISDMNEVRKNQPEVNNNGSVKKKNIIAQTLLNRSRSKLRVAPIRRN